MHGVMYISVGYGQDTVDKTIDSKRKIYSILNNTIDAADTIDSVTSDTYGHNVILSYSIAVEIKRDFTF